MTCNAQDVFGILWEAAVALSIGVGGTGINALNLNGQVVNRLQRLLIVFGVVHVVGRRMMLLKLGLAIHLFAFILMF